MVGPYISPAKKMRAGVVTWAVTAIMSQGLPAIANRKIRVSEVLQHTGLFEGSAEIRRITIKETVGEQQKQF